jgi:hypothetical protein
MVAYRVGEYIIEPGVQDDELSIIAPGNMLLVAFNIVGIFFIYFHNIIPTTTKCYNTPVIINGYTFKPIVYSDYI